jgi:hypothetical protein
MLKVPDTAAMVRFLSFNSTRMRSASSAGISSGIVGKPAQDMLNCTQPIL